MHLLEYPIKLQNDVQIVGEAECGGYLISYKNADGNNGIVWLRDELDNPCPVNSKAYEAIELVKKYINSTLIAP